MIALQETYLEKLNSSLRGLGSNYKDKIDSGTLKLIITCCYDNRMFCLKQKGKLGLEVGFAPDSFTVIDTYGLEMKYKSMDDFIERIADSLIFYPILVLDKRNAYCINIDSDVESWEISKREFAKVNMEVNRFSAIVEDNRPLAFNKSVHAALSLMPEGGWLFEDDVMFDCDQKLLQWTISGLPAGANSLHLGCNIIGTNDTVWRMPEFYNDRIARLWNCWQSHATWYSKECIEYILGNLRTDVLDEHNNIFDDWFRRNVLSDGNSYVCRPMLAYQRPRKSEIWNVHTDYTGAHKQGNEWLRLNL